jgi:hypothetical protein
MKPLNIIICIIIIILVYGIYLNINNSKIEGFGVNETENIEKLIETKEHQTFNVKIWDNESQLSSIYTDNIPIDLEQCKSTQKDQTKLINSCPLSIWRTASIEGYNSIGDVLTKSLKSPIQENIIDVRKPKVPGSIIEKSFTTMGVSGSILTEPEDYIYIGGFGKDVMIDKIERNEVFNKHMKKITFYMNLYSNTLELKKNNINTQIKTKNDQLIDIISNYIEKIKTLAQIEPLNNNVKNVLNKMMTDNVLTKNSKISFLANTAVTNANSQKSKILFNVNKNNISVDNTYNIDNIINSFPTSIKKIIFKYYDPTKIVSKYDLSNYTYKISNLNSVNIEQLIKKIASKLNVSVLDPRDEKEDEQKHFSIITPAGVNLDMKYTIYKKVRGKSVMDGVAGFFVEGSVKGLTQLRSFNENIVIGQYNNNDEAIFPNHSSRENGHNEIKKIISLELSMNPNVIEEIKLNILNDTDIKNINNQLISAIEDFKTEFPQFNKKDYHRLSIWQPIPPPGFIALGFIFTNDEKNIKPSKQLIKCIPESCVKNFKRRPWIPNEDMIFKYKDESQNLSFYRNPFLGTVIVVDENKQNGIYLNKTPSAIKYRNDKESLNWECFDIVPCIKESNYIKSLETADKSSKQMCKAFRGIENKIYDNSSVKQSIMDEEAKLNNVLKDKKKYLDGLMGKINSLMSEDELYKLISQGLNRYKMRKDLEAQRQLHGQVADKLLRTRGLEISWDASSEMGKFKDLVKKIVVAQYSKVNETKKDCPVCKIPDTSEYVKLKDLEMCYGCLEDVVRELINKKRTNGETVPEELLELENNINS